MSPFASWILVTVFVGGPTLLLFGLMRVAGRCSREEEVLIEELRRRAPKAKPTPAPRPYVRETHVLDYSTMTSADIAHALDHESTRSDATAA